MTDGIVHFLAWQPYNPERFSNNIIVIIILMLEVISLIVILCAFYALLETLELTLMMIEMARPHRCSFSLLCMCL